MDIEKLIEQHQKAYEYLRKNKPNLPDVAASYKAFATALSTLQAENEKLREMYQKEKAVCHAVQAELEQVKRERGAAIEAANGLDKMIGRAWGED